MSDRKTTQSPQVAVPPGSGSRGLGGGGADGLADASASARRSMSAAPDAGGTGHVSPGTAWIRRPSEGGRVKGYESSSSGKRWGLRGRWLWPRDGRRPGRPGLVNPIPGSGSAWSNGSSSAVAAGRTPGLDHGADRVDGVLVTAPRARPFGAAAVDGCAVRVPRLVHVWRDQRGPLRARLLRGAADRRRAGGDPADRESPHATAETARVLADPHPPARGEWVFLRAGRALEPHPRR